MNATYYPLWDLRTSLQSYLDYPKERSGKLYKHAKIAITEMHSAMADYMLTSKDDSILKRYMRTWQEQIRVLFDEIPDDWFEDMDLQTACTKSDKQSIQKWNICFECFRLIREMQLAYPTFFDKTACPPLLYIQLEKSSHYNNWLFISKYAKEKRGKLRLVWKIIAAYQERLWSNYSRFSYAEIEYGCNFVDQLMHNIQQRGDAFGLKALYSFLIYLNFNDIGFAQHLIADIAEETDALLIEDEKTAWLLQVKLDMDTATVRTDCTLDTGNPPINVMISNWIKRELKMLQT
ncbi:hypothetical protein [[Flexibacter] sp. ATCC 35208]|uniref:hypothetical protein n=1 Tax=[Flexibacter] sp. ATCC 35208 TaxID=1936242 RepID=UPI0009D28255|nr:hypothetical protein [[Flexibacter] sp. ATCC 35208]OMP75097.1 hypothetical protein BW716_32010 [[Flexibacter] sp. ATCC 35208]